jgi:hypothetical protein
MASISKTANDFVINQGLALKTGANAAARIISYAGNPNGAAITPIPTLGTIAIDSTTGNMYQWITGTTWNQFTTGALNATGLDFKQSVKAATTANITLASAAPNTLDGVTLTAGDRILVKNQTAGAQNGIYVITTLGTGSNGVWTRAVDADSTAELNTGAFIAVEQGTLYASTMWLLTTPNVTLDTTALTFTNYGTYTAGNGIAIVTGVISAVADPVGGLSVTSSGIKALAADNSIAISASGIAAVLATTSGLSKTSGLAVVAQAAGGINVTGSGIGITILQQAAGVAGGLTVTATGLGLSLDATPGLQTTTGLKVLTDPAGAIAVGASGIKLNADTTNGSTAIVGNALVIPGSIRKTIPSATASQIVDSVPIATYSAARWLVSVRNATTGRYASTIQAVNLGAGTTVDATEFGVVAVGSFTTNNPAFTVTNDGTNMILTFTGDAGNTITVSRDAI